MEAPHPPYLCSYFDFAIASQIPLPELARSENGSEYLYRVETARLGIPESLPWRRSWLLPSGEVFLSIGSHENDHVLRFPRSADFLVDEDNGVIRFESRPGVSEYFIRHLLLDQVLPRVVSHSGRLVIHAGAVADESGILAFAGQTGSGKSTLSANFHYAGYRLLTDDCLLLEECGGRIHGVPAYPSLRLGEDSATALFPEVEFAVDDPAWWKQRFPPSADVAAASEVRAVFILGAPEEMAEAQRIVVTPLQRSDAMMELIRHDFPLDTTDRGSVGKQFKNAGAVAQATPMFELVYPWDHTQLPAVRDAVLRSVG